jgi:tetratricopeptide (TPR) repeat protein
MSSYFPDDTQNAYEPSLKEIEKLLKKDPVIKKWQFELSKCHFRIGSLRYTQRDFSAALNAFFNSLKILEKLTETDKDNTEWRKFLADCNDRIGDIYKEQKDISAAFYYYNSSLNIKEIRSQIEIINAFLNRLNNRLYEYVAGNREAGDNPRSS